MLSVHRTSCLSLKVSCNARPVSTTGCVFRQQDCHLSKCLQGPCISQVPSIAHIHSRPKRERKLQRAVAQGGAGAGISGNPLFANNPQFAAALQSVAARQGDEALYSAPPAVVPEEQTTPQEEMLLTSLQISRRNIRNFEAMKKTLEKSIESEEQQFERLHFAYKKVKSEGAYIKHLERRLAQEKAKNQGH